MASDRNATPPHDSRPPRTGAMLGAIGAFLAGIAAVATVIVTMTKDDPPKPPTAQPTATAVTLDQWAAAASKKCVEMEQESNQTEAALKEATAALDMGDPERAVAVFRSAINQIQDSYAELSRIPAPPDYQDDISEAIRLAILSFDHSVDAVEAAANNDRTGFNQGQQSASAVQGQAAAIFSRLGARGCGAT